MNESWEGRSRRLIGAARSVYLRKRFFDAQRQRDENIKLIVLIVVGGPNGRKPSCRDGDFVPIRKVQDTCHAQPAELALDVGLDDLAWVVSSSAHCRAAHGFVIDAKQKSAMRKDAKRKRPARPDDRPWNRRRRYGTTGVTSAPDGFPGSAQGCKNLVMLYGGKPDDGGRKSLSFCANDPAIKVGNLVAIPLLEGIS